MIDDRERKHHDEYLEGVRTLHWALDNFIRQSSQYLSDLQPNRTTRIKRVNRERIARMQRQLKAAQSLKSGLDQ